MKIFLTNRMKVSVLAGAALGVVCIIGALIRSGFKSEFSFLFSLWFNRVLMGMVVGLVTQKAQRAALVLRGAFLGLIVSFAFFSATGFADAVSFLAGVIYGIIIELAARPKTAQAGPVPGNG